MGSRRLWQTLITAASAGAAWTVYAWHESTRVEQTHTVIQIPDLPAGLEGLRILHIADTHFPRNGASLSRFLDTVAQMNYDIILATGDSCESRLGWPTVVEAFRRLDPKLGIYASIGGHERYRGVGSVRDLWSQILGALQIGEHATVDPTPLIEALEQEGVRVLVNEHVSVEISGELVRIVGIDDAYMGLADLDAAMPPDEGGPAAFNLLLSHTPDGLLHPRASEFPLALCGHTHGGQIRVPGYGAPVRHAAAVDRKRPDGLLRFGRTQAYVSRGFGTAGVPLRFGCRPEIGIVELRREWRSGAA